MRQRLLLTNNNLRSLAGLLLGAAMVLPVPSGMVHGAAPPVTIYVSTTGIDRNPGTVDAPVQSLSRAQALVRLDSQSEPGDITVEIESGAYRLVHPLSLTAADSGADGYSVNWTAQQPGTVTVTGSIPVTGWQQTDPSLNIWSASVPKGTRSRQLFVDGMRASLASGPLPVRVKQSYSGYTASSPLLSSWKNPSNIDFVWVGDLGPMVESECPLASIKGRSIRVAQPCWNSSTMRHWNWVGYTRVGVPAFVENAFELLREPGQFYLSSRAGIVYYIPRPGQDLSTADVEMPVSRTLIQGTGTPSTPIQNISFSGIEFAYTTWLGPSSADGFSEVQAGYAVTGSTGYARQGLCHLVSHGTCPYASWTPEPAAVTFTDDRNVTFYNDQFVHLGAAGLDLGDDSQGATVTQSVFTDIAGNGIEVGGVDQPSALPGYQTTGDIVSDNHIFGIGVEFDGAVGVLVGYAAETLVTHNQIDHVPYTAISIGWGGWPDKGRRPPLPSYSASNVVSDNLIFDYMQQLTDGGGVYTLGIQGASFSDGEMVAGNVIYGQLGWSSALKSDNGATYVTYSHNVSYDNTYDWDGNHPDYRPHHATKYDPQVVTDNYWQQGFPDSSSRGTVANGNQVIPGRGGAPTGILQAAGLEPAYQSVVDWRPESTDVPNPPQTVAVLYAFDGAAYVTWRPSFAEGSGPVTSYTVTACPLIVENCDQIGLPADTISNSDYTSAGYAAVTGLVTGKRYTFRVTASNHAGAGTPSLPSPPAPIASHKPGKPGKVSGVVPQPASHAIRLLWYAPKSSSCPRSSYDSWKGCTTPVLQYVVKSSTGSRYPVSSLSQLVVSNHYGRVLDVIGGLQPGRAYRFSISAVNPSGSGPSFTSYSVAPDG